jgi:ribosomal protein L11 methyltransferase
MRRVRFEVPEEQLDAVLDGVLALFPAGARTLQVAPGRIEVSALAPASRMPARAALEAAAGCPLPGWAEEDAPADWHQRRVRSDVMIADRVVVRRPEDPAPADGLLDIVLHHESGFGTGAHPTTRMCAALMLELEPEGGFTDVGCGVGTLAILAAKLGFSPVVGVDREPAAIDAAMHNAAANGVAVSVVLADAMAGPPAPSPVMAINAPPAVHDRVAATLSPDTTSVIVSGAVASELDVVLAAYGVAGLSPDRRIDWDAVWSAVLLRRD